PHSRYGRRVASPSAGGYGNARASTRALWCFTRCNDDLDQQRRGPAAGVIGALSACCHPIGFGLVIVGLLAIVGAAAIFDLERAAGHLVHLGTTVLLTVLISAFWYLPFLSLRLYTNDLSFSCVTGLGLLFPLPPA